MIICDYYYTDLTEEMPTPCEAAAHRNLGQGKGAESWMGYFDEIIREIRGGESN